MKFLLSMIAIFTVTMAWANDVSPTTRLRGFTVPYSTQVLKPAVDFGANAVRLMTKPKVKVNEDGTYVLDISHIKTFLEAAEKENIAVILDLHGVPNPNSKNYQKDSKGARSDFWNDDSNLTFMIRFWSEVAEFCKDRKQTIWFDLLNEPLDWNDFPSSPKKWPAWAQTLIDTIRKIDRRHEIVIEPGPGGLCWGFKTFPALKGEGLIYSTHNYQPHAYTHQGISSLENTDLAKAYLKMNQSWPGEYSDSNGGVWDAKRLESELAPVINFQKKNKVRVYIGEFGVVRWAPNADKYLRDNMELFEKYGWDWTYHSFREFHGWSFEYEPTFGNVEKAKEPTAAAKVMKEFIDRNKNPEIYAQKICPEVTRYDQEQNEYPDSAIGIRCNIVSNKIVLKPEGSTSKGSIRFRPWGVQDKTKEYYLFFQQNFVAGYEWQDFSFSFTAEESGNVSLQLAGIHWVKGLTWTCYDNIKINGAASKGNGSFENIDAKGNPVNWSLGKDVKLIKAHDYADDGSNFVMAAEERHATQDITVAAGQKVTVTGKARRAGKFERELIVDAAKQTGTEKQP